MKNNYMRYDVFLSFSSKDEKEAKILYEKLKSNELKVFYSNENLKTNAGQAYLSKISDALDQSCHFILLCTENTKESKFVKIEYETFFEIHIKNEEKRRLILYYNNDDYEELGLPSILNRYQKVNSLENLIDIFLDNSDKLSIYSDILKSHINENLVLELYGLKNHKDICINTFITYENDDKKRPIKIFETLVNNRISIIGDPGSGKTTALRKLALDLIEDKPIQYIPIYISIASFYIYFQDNSKITFLEYINNEISIFGCKNIEDLSANSKYQILLLLDGLDELQDKKAKQLILKFLSQTEYKFIITTRTESQKDLPYSERFFMHPLSQKSVHEFVQRRMPNSNTSKKFLKWLFSTPEMLKMAENPLNLSVMLIVFNEEGRRIGRPTKTMLYERAFDTFLRQHHRVHDYNTFRYGDEDQSLRIEELLQKIAYKTIELGEGRFFSLSQLNKCVVEIWGKIPADILTLLTGKLGIIRDRKAGRLEFFHTWFQELLAAKEILDMKDKFINILNDKKFSNVLPYIIGLMPKREDAFKVMCDVDIHDSFNYCRAILECNFNEDEIDELLKKIIEHGEFREPKIPVRVELAHALSQAGQPIIKGLFRILKNENLNDYTRRAALEALAILLTDQDNLEDVIVKILNTQSLGLLWHLIEHCGNKKIGKSIHQIKKHLTNNNPIVVGDSLWALSEILDTPISDIKPEIIEGLFDCLESGDNHTQGHALRTIGRLKLSNSLKRLKNHLLKKKAAYRWIVPESAAMIGGKMAYDIIKLALVDKDPRVIASALNSISEIKDISKDTIGKVSNYLDDNTWIPSMNTSLSKIALSTYNKLIYRAENIFLNRLKYAKLFIARHCSTKYTLEKRLQGSLDISLSYEGKIEAKDIASNISFLKFDKIYSSPLKRALETAKIYSEYLNVPVIKDKRLVEIDHGDWEGKLIEELISDPKYRYKQWIENPLNVSIPNSKEDIVEAQKRIVDAVKEIATQNLGQNILIVTHKHIRSTLISSMSGENLANFKTNISDSIKPFEVTNSQIKVLLERD